MDISLFINILLIFLLIIWSLAWKGYALWTAAKKNHRWWFVFILILNTVGILDIIYLFAVAKKKWKDVEKDAHSDV